MTASIIIQKSKAYATRIILEELSKDFIYHDLGHTVSVVDCSISLAKHYQLSENELEVLTIAGWFHDLGYLNAYQGHELSSKQMAKDFLIKENYPTSKIEAVLACIHATIVEEVPQSISQEIIKDADLASLGSEDFDEFSRKLRYEWLHFCDEIYTDKEWYEINYNFLNGHKYFTKEANRIFNEKKAENLAEMKGRLGM